MIFCFDVFIITFLLKISCELIAIRFEQKQAMYNINLKGTELHYKYNCTTIYNFKCKKKLNYSKLLFANEYLASI